MNGGITTQPDQRRPASTAPATNCLYWLGDCQAPQRRTNSSLNWILHLQRGIGNDHHRDRQVDGRILRHHGRDHPCSMGRGWADAPSATAFRRLLQVKAVAGSKWPRGVGNDVVDERLHAVPRVLSSQVESPDGSESTANTGTGLVPGSIKPGTSLAGVRVTLPGHVNARFSTGAYLSFAAIPVSVSRRAAARPTVASLPLAGRFAASASTLAARARSRLLASRRVLA